MKTNIEQIKDLSGDIHPIKFYRELQGITQRELAAKISANQKDISRWENSKRVPSVNSLVKLSIALSCKMEDLVYSKNKQKINNIFVLYFLCFYVDTTRLVMYNLVVLRDVI